MNFVLLEEAKITNRQRIYEMKKVNITCFETSGWKPDVQVKDGYNQENGWFEWSGQD